QQLEFSLDRSAIVSNQKAHLPRNFRMIFRKNHDGSAKLVLDLHSGLSRRPCPISIGQTRYRSC
ncbi:MAG: hypothetical protein DMF35_08820, partial [Verrucomicrobia bacterium]